MFTLDSEDISNPTISSLYLVPAIFTPNPAYVSPDSPQTSGSAVWSLGVILIELFFGDIKERGTDLDITKMPKRISCQLELLKILAGMTYRGQKRYTLEEAAEALMKIQRETSKVIHAPATLAAVQPRYPTKTPPRLATQLKPSKTLEMEGKKVSYSRNSTGGFNRDNIFKPC